MKDKETLIEISYELGECLKYLLAKCQLDSTDMLYAHLVKANLHMLVLNIAEYIQKSQAQQVTTEGIQLFIDRMTRMLNESMPGAELATV